MAALDPETRKIIDGELKLLTLYAAREAKLADEIAALREEQRKARKNVKTKRDTIVDFGGEEMLNKWDEENAPQEPAGDAGNAGDGQAEHHEHRELAPA
jgi:hypothetical protein